MWSNKKEEEEKLKFYSGRKIENCGKIEFC